jgi:hypothetical protein
VELVVISREGAFQSQRWLLIGYGKQHRPTEFNWFIWRVDWWLVVELVLSTI